MFAGIIFGNVEYSLDIKPKNRKKYLHIKYVKDVYPAKRSVLVFNAPVYIIATEKV